MAIYGIDISAQNGDIDFMQIKAAGVRFAFVKATQGHALNSGRYLFEDAKFERNTVGLSSVGIAVGLYHFFTAASIEECIEEADYFIGAVKRRIKKAPLYLICSAETFGNRYLSELSRYQLTVLLKLFCDRVREAGFEPCVYINHDYPGNVVDLTRLELPIWQAKYGANVSRPLDVGERLAAHRYTASGTLPGVAGSFGLDFGYAPLARRMLKCSGIGDETIELIGRCDNGEELLIKIADKSAQRGLKPIRSPDTMRLASLIRWYCGLGADSMNGLLKHERAAEILHEIYTAMLRAC